MGDGVDDALLAESAEDLYEHAPCGYLSTLPDSTVVRVNHTFCDWTGYAAADLVGRRRLVDLMTAGGRIFHETHYAPLLRMQGAVREIALDLVCADGSVLPVLLNSVQRVDDNGDPAVIRTTVFNATDRRSYELELVRQRHEAEQVAVQMRALQQVTAELAASLSVVDIALVLERAAVEVLGAASSTLWVIDFRAHALVRPGGKDGRMSLDLDNDQTESLRSSSVRTSSPRAHVVSATVPLLVEDRTLGVLAFEFSQDKPLDDSHLEVLRTLGGQAGQAMERARLHDEAVAQGRRAAFLLDASSVLAAATDFTETIERLAEVAVPRLGDLCMIDVLDEDGNLIRMTARHADASKQTLVDELRHRYPPLPTSNVPSVRAVSERKSHWSPYTDDDFLRATVRDDAHFAMVKALGFAGFMAVPLIAGDRVVGAITLLSSGSGRRFTHEDLLLVEDLAERVALVVDKAERYDREIRTSHTLQASLLPRALPKVQGLTIAVRYLPGTRDVEVGGDFYDVVALANGDVAFVVGDVVGHDVTAAANMGQLRSAARTLVGDVDGPAALVRRLQETWDRLDVDRLATAVFGLLRPSDGRLRIASAGHPPPLFVHGEEAWFAPVEPAPPLGAPSAEVQEWVGKLPAGATMLLYTDGLVENRLLEFDDGTMRLAAAAIDARTSEPEKLCDHILAAVAGDERSDDVALLAISSSLG